MRNTKCLLRIYVKRRYPHASRQRALPKRLALAMNAEKGPCPTASETSQTALTRQNVLFESGLKPSSSLTPSSGCSVTQKGGLYVNRISKLCESDPRLGEAHRTCASATAPRMVHLAGTPLPDLGAYTASLHSVS